MHAKYVGEYSRQKKPVDRPCGARAAGTPGTELPGNMKHKGEEGNRRMCKTLEGLRL